MDVPGEMGMMKLFSNIDFNIIFFRETRFMIETFF